MAKGLKFRIQVVEGLYYPYSENKGTDQLRSYCAADLRLCFRICKRPVFSQRDSYDPHHEKILFMHQSVVTTAPHRQGLEGFGIFVQQIPAMSPALRGQPVGKTTAVFAPSLLCFTLHCQFCLYLTQIPCICPAMRDIAKVCPIIAHPTLVMEAVVSNDWFIMPLDAYNKGAHNPAQMCSLIGSYIGCFPHNMKFLHLYFLPLASLYGCLNPVERLSCNRAHKIV